MYMSGSREKVPNFGKLFVGPLGHRVKLFRSSALATTGGHRRRSASSMREEGAEHVATEILQVFVLLVEVLNETAGSVDVDIDDLADGEFLLDLSTSNGAIRVVER